MTDRTALHRCVTAELVDPPLGPGLRLSLGYRRLVLDAAASRRECRARRRRREGEGGCSGAVRDGRSPWDGVAARSGRFVSAGRRGRSPGQGEAAQRAMEGDFRAAGAQVAGPGRAGSVWRPTGEWTKGQKGRFFTVRTRRSVVGRWRRRPSRGAVGGVRARRRRRGCGESERSAVSRWRRRGSSPT